MSRILLAVDLSYQTYRAAASHNTLSCGSIFTGGLYGFLQTLAKQIRITKATHVLVCEDRKPYRRSEVYPQYKQLRKKSADDDLLLKFQVSLPLVVEALGTIGIPVMGVNGFESDDCIGWVSKTHRHRFDLIYGASNDSDLYQLLKYQGFRILKGSELSDVVTVERLAAGPFGMTPDEYMLAQALQGTHNDVEGIPRVGPKTAYDAVKQPHLMRRLRERWAEVIDRNMELQKLPHPDFPRVTLPPMGSFNPRPLYRFCGRFDIEVTANMLSSFQQVCP